MTDINIADIYANQEYGTSRPVLKLLFNTGVSKELRITMRKGQQLPQHTTTSPIIIQVVEGSLDFGYSQQRLILKKGTLITLEANQPHDLQALEDCIVRLSILYAHTNHVH